jgi:enoyl-CoA hydratase
MILPTPEGPGPHESDLGRPHQRFKTPDDHASGKNTDPGDRSATGEVRLSVIISRDGPVMIVTIDRPARRNAVDPGTAIALREAFAAFADDSDARVAILTGSAGHFCAGFDLNAVGASRYDPDGPGPMGPTRMLLDKPVIAAVEGHAVAGGLELALWCDLRVAAASAVFGVYCRRWGVPLIDGGTVRLPRIVGQGRALDMILTGRSVEAQEAHHIGLVDRIVADGEAMSAAIALAKQIAVFPQLCMNSDRLSAYRQWDFDLEAALAHEAHAGTAPLREGATAGAKRFTEGEGRGGSFATFTGE